MSTLFADSASVCITSFISPYAEDRAVARKLHAEHAPPLPFVEVFVDASIEKCEERDPKGLYKRARAGEIKSFTGISADAPYERPVDPEILIRADSTSVTDAVKEIVAYLQAKQLI